MLLVLRVWYGLVIKWY